MARKKIITFLLIMMLPVLTIASSDKKILENNLQMILVLADNWDSIQCNLFLYERKNSQEPWELLHKAIPVVVGKKGMGWEKKSYADIFPGPLKKEGDLKAPAGITELGQAFGFSKKLANNKEYPYLHLTNSLECVDDKESKHYNKIIDSSTLKKDWHSSEKMRDIELYEFGLVTGFNNTLDAEVAIP
ncbi:MAG: hypothetical protein HRT87_08755 [Legionellales bacterium]|nr:hypothetical protein [Legionellales bacterium]